MYRSSATSRPTRRELFVALFGSLTAIILVLAGARGAVGTALATPADGAGYIDFSFYYPSIVGNPTSADQVLTPTGEKPQSKLWFNDGRWWADLFYPADGTYHIYWLNTATQQWIVTSTVLDARPRTKADCLWDGTHLYVVSGGGQISTGADLDAKLYRYSYHSASHSYTPDLGFPVTVRAGGAETIVIDKDTKGKLWVTYTQNNQVYVNRSLSSDTSWDTPIVVPASGVSATVDPDDISSLIAYDGKIGVFWSSHLDGNFYFAYHADTNTSSHNAGDWAGQTVIGAAGLADDHMNLKSLVADPRGNVFAAIKTSLTDPNQPRIMLVVGKKQPNGSLSWLAYDVSNGSMNQTRPVVLIDTTNRDLFVFLSDEGGGKVYYKRTSLDNIAFNPSVKGTDFIADSHYPYMNNVTSTKQNVNGSTDIVVLASSSNDGHSGANPASTDFYMHNTLALADPPNPTSTATPTRTATPTQTVIAAFKKRYLPLLLK
jgi:hypothetical protein